MEDSRRVVDQMHRDILIPAQPKRIVSLVPSQTEFLLDIGANVVGRTKFCIHPKEKVSPIPAIGGTKKFRFDEIDKLKPDLIIGNKEENYESGITELSDKYPVWMSDITTAEDALNMMRSLGRICNKNSEATNIVSSCQKALVEAAGTRSGKVLYFIWQNPWMVAGKGTFIDTMLELLGYENVIKKKRYPELSEEELKELNPETVLLSSEPFPFKEQHLSGMSKRWPNAICEVVDGELYSWYGSRLSKWSSSSN